MISFGRMVILVKGYEDALSFYVEKLGLELSTDVEAGERRFIHLTFPRQKDAGVWLLKAETERDLAAVGRQAGDQPIGVLYTDSFYDEFDRLQGMGVRFLEQPVEAEGAISAHFSDLYGNKLVLVQVGNAEPV
ncbi:VOC family protein [Microbulbifer halophilus]|uniref:VOC family protein n=1 Tax=Microbulbifer halophilus TaxID=453963 RepID=A0ABW5EJF5_9GAMM|nr:VOC family protein [Microbulbifer halophilus]MCW8128372.1 VOC family protein [Microbulbifer halophilus]